MKIVTQRFGLRAAAVILAVGAVCSANAAIAASQPTTRLVSCGDGSCLLVSGHRADAESMVTINGHSVTAEGGRAWRVRLPVQTVREWSLPLARTIDVAVADQAGGDAQPVRARLPIGLLGQSTELASLVIGSP